MFLKEPQAITATGAKTKDQIPPYPSPPYPTCPVTIFFDSSLHTHRLHPRRRRSKAASPLPCWQSSSWCAVWRPVQTGIPCGDPRERFGGRTPTGNLPRRAPSFPGGHHPPPEGLRTGESRAGSSGSPRRHTSELLADGGNDAGASPLPDRGP